MHELMERARAGEELTVDLEARTAGGFPFELDDFTRDCLLEGLDEIALTLPRRAGDRRVRASARLTFCPFLRRPEASDHVALRTCTSRRPS